MPKINRLFDDLIWTIYWGLIVIWTDADSETPNNIGKYYFRALTLYNIKEDVVWDVILSNARKVGCRLSLRQQMLALVCITHCKSYETEVIARRIGASYEAVADFEKLVVITFQPEKLN